MLFRAYPILKGITSLNYPALQENRIALVDFAEIGTKNRECSVKMTDTNNKKPRNRTCLKVINEYVGHNFSIIPLTDSGAKIGKIDKPLNVKRACWYRLLKNSN